MLRRFVRLARAVARSGGRVTFEWPRYCSGWSLKELVLVRDQLDPDLMYLAPGMLENHRKPINHGMFTTYYLVVRIS